ncbi:hypothetical protein J3T65_09860 [Staphylococcus simiae]|uniref:hypothetical protein n=1 Tax=Staphylococcus simiae TaxID=308354 RepID=UPI001A9A02DA|nr:hypothetical protein [Staphylococcus simiae]MBO1198289.1 hypothetical protein [Staphylococcus simiae]MBO1201976.1 hypothetical protein [Staphylococcus simiae]MBO1204192.1 hypothetical protein [Staphylococcus simiae]MBO1210281.1 hypothetical protein [Staphylococcus simiae]MBO1230426.1 hypothetical protein [Staphylococcus simiae]
MKTFFASIGVLLLVVILAIAVVFTYESYNELQSKKQKLQTEQKQIKKDKEDKKENTQVNNNEASQTEQNQQQVNQGIFSNTEPVNNTTNNSTQQSEAKEPVYSAHGREAELDAEAEVKSPGEPGSTSREITPETDPDLFDLDDKNK